MSLSNPVDEMVAIVATHSVYLFEPCMPRLCSSQTCSCAKPNDAILPLFIRINIAAVVSQRLAAPPSLRAVLEGHANPKAVRSRIVLQNLGLRRTSHPFYLSLTRCHGDSRSSGKISVLGQSGVLVWWGGKLRPKL